MIHWPTRYARVAGVSWIAMVLAPAAHAVCDPTPAIVYQNNWATYGQIPGYISVQQPLPSPQFASPLDIVDPIRQQFTRRRN